MLFVGQTPPPAGGQANMVALTLQGGYEGFELRHLDVKLSPVLAEMGRWRFRKILRVLRHAVSALVVSLAWRPHILYFHPAGANATAVLRDAVLLAATRPFCERTIFHVHSRGAAGAIASLPRWVGGLVQKAYAQPSCVIAPSSVTLDEWRELSQPASMRVVPNATTGPPGPRLRSREPMALPRVLYMNVVSEEKGALVLLRALAVVRASGCALKATFVGEFASHAFRSRFTSCLEAAGLQDVVEIVPAVPASERWAFFQSHDVLCFPTMHPSETFGLVLVEAAACAMPAISSDVPGVREVLTTGRSVRRVEAGDPDALAEEIVGLCSDPELRRRIGAAAFDEFVQHYAAPVYWAEIEEVLRSTACA